MCFFLIYKVELSCFWNTCMGDLPDSTELYPYLTEIVRSASVAKFM